MSRSPLNLYIAYDEADAEQQKEFLPHLVSWKRSGKITIWSHDDLIAGKNTNEQILAHLEQADIVLLLLSANFLASQEYDLIVPRAMELRKAGKTRVIPILVHPVDLDETPFAPLKKLPPEALPVTNWTSHDDAWYAVQQGIGRVMNELQEAAPEKSNVVDEGKQEKEAHLQGIWTDQQDFIQDRYDRFVGREAELNEIRARIDGKMERGGYVIITGKAGQGKSSIIAKMIVDQGIDATTYHFVQRSEYQLNVVRKLLARLILKYNLPERYIAGESYPILCDYFSRALTDISQQGKQEIIYIDGLDQLDTNRSSTPDLNFLPPQLPSGIVIVTGTRPNNTWQEVKNRTRTANSYTLEGLRREDFDLLLAARGLLSLRTTISDSLYLSLKQNVLYLDLVVQELLAQPDLPANELIARLANNPDDIFTITFSRMEKLPEWHTVIRPMLGVLLVAQEALTSLQIAHILKMPSSASVRAGITYLGGLLTFGSYQSYTLFHPKLAEYLEPGIDVPENAIQFDAEEVQTEHGRLANWCSQGSMERLWQTLPSPGVRDDYQEYSQKHYITHLFHAGRDNELFAVLNNGDYERGKLRFDRSTRATAVDLMLGCQAAAREAATLADGKTRLINLWRYTLLRTNLTTRADAYPIEAFQALLALSRESEAFDLAELLTQPARKLAVLVLLTEYLFKQSARHMEAVQLYTRVHEIATSIKDSKTSTRALGDLVGALIKTQHLRRAADVALSIRDTKKRAEVLYAVSDAYGKQNNWSEAEALAREIAVVEERVRTLSNLAAQLKLANQEERAEELWQEASTLTSTIEDGDQRDKALSHLTSSFIQAQEWQRAEITARSIQGNEEKIAALCQLALSFSQNGLPLQAEPIWDEAQILASDIPAIEDRRDKAYRIYATTLVLAGSQERAETIAKRKIDDSTQKIAVFTSLASSFIKEDAWHHCQRIIDLIVKEYNLTDVDYDLLDTILIDLSADLAQNDQWEQAKDTALAIPRKDAQCRALMRIASIMAQAGLHEQAQKTWEEASSLFRVQTDAVQEEVTGILVSALIEVGQVEQAEKLLPTLPDKKTQEAIREKIAIALARAGKTSEAEEFARTTTNPRSNANIRRCIALAQINAGEPAQARDTALSISNGGEAQSKVLSELVTICCQRQQWDLAQEIARQIQSDNIQARAIGCIAVGLVQVGKASEAEQIARSIKNDFLKANVICDLATFLAQRGGYKRAEQLAHSIKNPRIQKKALTNISMTSLFGLEAAENEALAIEYGEEREEALFTVAAAYIREKAWENAENIAKEMMDQGKRNQVWGTIARERAREERWTEAITAYDTIQQGKEGTKERTKVLHAWGELLARQENKAITARIMQQLSRSQEKAALLVPMADTLAQAGHYLEAIHLTQNAWLQANQKEDCQYLFAMIQKLLLLSPEICPDFYQSFTWVDRFLKE